MGRPGLHNHPKFRRLVDILKCPVPHVRGYLECLWEVAYECGNDYLGDARDVELAAQWPGEDGQFCSAAVVAKLLDKKRDGFYVHNLFENAPNYVKNRMVREAARKLRGVTLSDLRRQAGSKGGKAKSKNKQNVANGSNLPTLVNPQLANERTPAPAPAPAPVLNTNNNPQAEFGRKYLGFLPPRFDSEAVRESLWEWRSHFAAVHHGQAFDDMKILALLKYRGEMQWDAGKLVRAINASIAAGAKSIFDPDAGRNGHKPRTSKTAPEKRAELDSLYPTLTTPRKP